MKRAIALIAAIMLLFSAIQLPVYASTNTRQGDVTISVDNVTSEAGSDVLVSVKINGQYDANILHLFLNYDADKVQLNGDLTKGPVWNSIEENNGYAVTNTAGSGKIGFIALLPQGTFNGTGTVFTASFHVSEDIAAGTVIPLNVSVSQFSNDALDGTSTAISFAAENGSITVPRPHAMEAVVSADRIEVEPGSEAEIAVSVTGDYQANILQLSVEFDAESVSLAADPISGAIWNAFTENGGYVATNTAEEGKIGFIAILPQGSVEDEGTVFTLRFTIADDVAAGTVLPITVTVDQFSYDGIDGTSSNVACTIENGSITIVTPVVETYTITYTINGEEYSYTPPVNNNDISNVIDGSSINPVENSNKPNFNPLIPGKTSQNSEMYTPGVVDNPTDNTDNGGNSNNNGNSNENTNENTNNGGADNRASPNGGDSSNSYSNSSLPITISIPSDIVSNNTDATPSDVGSQSLVGSSESGGGSPSVSKKAYELEDLTKTEFIPSIFYVIATLVLFIIGYRRKNSNFD